MHAQTHTHKDGGDHSSRESQSVKDHSSIQHHTSHPTPVPLHPPALHTGVPYPPHFWQGREPQEATTSPRNSTAFFKWGFSSQAKEKRRKQEERNL